MPLVSVVITTYDRADRAAVAIDSVLSLGGAAALEVVVVDDGSHPEHALAIDALAGGPVTVLHQENQGLGAARVSGASVATGEWIGFLDDDDRLLPGWSDLVELIRTHPDAGIVSGSARLVDAAGEHLDDVAPAQLGPIFQEMTLQYLAGCFLVRRDVYEQAGGYLAGLSGSHQYELMIRCTAVANRMGLRAAHTDTAVAAIERPPKVDRPLSNPRLSLACTRWVLARHAARFDLDERERSNWEGVASLNALRLGDPSAVRLAWGAARHQPSDPRRWARAVMVSTPLGRRRWGTAERFAAPAERQANPLAHAVSFWGTPYAALGSPADHLFLPWSYRENPPASADSAGTPFWSRGVAGTDLRAQDPVYRWAARLTRSGAECVVDVGCGTGHKLVRRVAPHARRWVGVDQSSALELARREFPDGNWLEADLSVAASWDLVAALHPDLVICSDVIEHVVDPLSLLRGLRRTIGERGQLLLSTPDRGRLEDRDDQGPPPNPRHVREWNEAELRLLVEAAGFRIVRVRHLLPRSYSLTGVDVRRTVYRGIHRMAVPDRRTCMAFLLRSTADPSSGR